MERAKFFSVVRSRLYGGTIRNSQVIVGLSVILDRAERFDWPVAWVAYLMATVYHETAHTFEAIREFGRGKGRKYGGKAGPFGLIYYGRGWPQLTWFENYVKQEKKLGHRLASNPDLMLQVAVSADVTFGGMQDGDFTGKKLADYMRAKPDFVGARRIINGNDRAYRIAGHAEVFLDGLIAAGYGKGVPVTLPDPVKKHNPDAIKDKSAGGGAVAGGSGAAAPAAVDVDPAFADYLPYVGGAVAVACIVFLCWRYREHLKMAGSRVADRFEAMTKGL